jgi:uncharacterized protein YebE (UPF0316 family)
MHSSPPKTYDLFGVVSGGHKYSEISDMSSFVQTALLIFFLRVVDVSFYILRLLMVMRGRRFYAWLFGFFQASIYITAAVVVLTNLDNWLNVIGYAAGFATGNVIGMLIEDRLAIGIIHLRVISPARGSELVEHLRQAGYAVTEFVGRGKDGVVTIFNCHIRRREVSKVTSLITSLDEQAFITAENVRLVWHGFWRSS